MNTYDNGLAVRVAPPAAAPIGLSDSRPLVQSLMLPHGVTSGHWYTAGLNSHGLPVGRGETRVDAFVGDTGHWWLNTDPGLETTCRGCGWGGDFVGTFAARCPKPASAQDIASALLADFPRPAPSVPRPLYGVAL